MQTPRTSTPSKYPVKVRRAYVRIERNEVPAFLRIRRDDLHRNDDSRVLRRVRRSAVA